MELADYNYKNKIRKKDNSTDDEGGTRPKHQIAKRHISWNKNFSNYFKFCLKRLHMWIRIKDDGHKKDVNDSLEKDLTFDQRGKDSAVDDVGEENHHDEDDTDASHVENVPYYSGEKLISAAFYGVNQEEEAINAIQDDIDGQEVDSMDYTVAENGMNLETDDSLFYGTCETQVIRGAAADLDTYFNSCKQNPGPRNFIPVKDFNIDHLPAGYHDHDIAEYIKATADLTVRVAVKMTSAERPECWPETNKPYPFKNKGCDIIRVGTGMLWYVNKLASEDIKEYNKGTCKCHKCQHSDTPSTEWGEVTMFTATHMVFDDLEARHTSCRLFYDTQDSPQVTLDGWMVVEANIDEDWCMLECVTCDIGLLHKLDEMMKHMLDVSDKVNTKYTSSIDKDLTFKVVHPLGYPKHVSLEQKTTHSSSDVKNLTSRLQENWLFLVKETGHKLQIASTNPEGWITLNLIITTDIPVEISNGNSYYPTASGSATQDEEVKKALTCVLLMNAYIKELFIKVMLESEEDNQMKCVKMMFDEFQQISEKIITMNSRMSNNFMSLYRDLVNESEVIVTAFKSGMWSTPFSDDLIKTTEENLLCDVLGLLPNFAHTLQFFDDFDKNHQPIHYYIKKWFIRCLYRRLNISDDCSAYVDGIDLEKAFVAMEFSDEAARTIVSSIDTEFQRNQPIIYWALRHINYMLSSHILLRKDTYADYQPSRINEWFSEALDRPKWCEPPTNPTLQSSIHMFNSIIRNAADNLTEEDIIKHCQPGTDLWYHGTDSDSTHSILKEGILLKLGSAQQDFSHSNGFYVSNNFESAKRLAHKCDHNGGAVLVYKMNIESSDWKVLDLVNDNVTWRKVIQYYRSTSGKEEFNVSIPDEFNPEQGEPVMRQIHIDDLDCIKGLICSNVKNMLDDSKNENIPVIEIDNVPVQQMCVKKPALAKYFGSLGNICAVIWFPAH